ncbi:MAG: hypothetical protein M3Q19_02355 [Pseudomonadota bacterium]|nr:hypothetical protein [Pseudomonadota bacterium]
MEALEAHVEDIQKAVFNGRYSASIHLLAGYSLELLLKCACYLHGGEEGRLRSRKLRHDLTALLDEAEALGYGSAVPNIRWVAENLREPHLNHQFRYGGAEQVAMPELEVTLEVLRGLCIELKGPVEEGLAAQ